MGLFSALGITKNDDQKKAEKDFDFQKRVERERRQKLDAQSDDARNRYVEGLNEFDPTSYMSSAAGAVGEQLSEDLAGTQARSRQQLNARGFGPGASLNTARISQDFNDRLSRALAALSFDAAGLELSRLSGFGDLYGLDSGRADYTRGNELDLTADVMHRERDDRAGRLGGTMDLVGAGSKFLGGL